MSIAKIQSGDTVKVIAGSYKGIVGEVLKIRKTLSKNGILKVRASISGVSKIAKYRKSSNFQGQQYPGLKTETDRFIDLSNLTHLTTDSKPSKVKIEISENGKKTRVLKKSGKLISQTKLPKPKKTLKEEKSK